MYTLFGSETGYDIGGQHGEEEEEKASLVSCDPFLHMGVLQAPSRSSGNSGVPSKAGDHIARGHDDHRKKRNSFVEAATGRDRQPLRRQQAASTELP